MNNEKQIKLLDKFSIILVFVIGIIGGFVIGLGFLVNIRK